MPLTIFKFALFLLLIIINNFVILIFASGSLTRRTFCTTRQSSYCVEMMLRRGREGDIS